MNGSRKAAVASCVAFHPFYQFSPESSNLLGDLWFRTLFSVEWYSGEWYTVLVPVLLQYPSVGKKLLHYSAQYCISHFQWDTAYSITPTTFSVTAETISFSHFFLFYITWGLLHHPSTEPVAFSSTEHGINIFHWKFHSIASRVVPVGNKVAVVVESNSSNVHLISNIYMNFDSALHWSYGPSSSSK